MNEASKKRVRIPPRVKKSLSASVERGEDGCSLRRSDSFRD